MEAAALTVTEDCCDDTEIQSQSNSPLAASLLNSSETDYEIVNMTSSIGEDCSTKEKDNFRSLSIEDIHDNFIIRLPMTPKLKGKLILFGDSLQK